jgi:hypothetical protein
MQRFGQLLAVFCRLELNETIDRARSAALHPAHSRVLDQFG